MTFKGKRKARVAGKRSGERERNLNGRRTGCSLELVGAGRLVWPTGADTRRKHTRRNVARFVASRTVHRHTCSHGYSRTLPREYIYLASIIYRVALSSLTRCIVFVSRSSSGYCCWKKFEIVHCAVLSCDIVEILYQSRMRVERDGYFVCFFSFCLRKL